MNIDNWKEFKVGELFDATRGKSRRMQILEDGDIPLIAAARNNRGIAGTYNTDAEYENSITVSCNGVGCGSAFYHNYPFSITGDAIVLEEKQDMSDYIKQFIASIIDASFTNKYSYEEKCSADKAKNETILLPATPSGDPDWDYMESYMKEMEEKAKERLDRLEEMRKQEKKKIDVSGWGEFQVGELFDIKPTKAYKLNNAFLLDDGNTPVLANSSYNNGIGGYSTLEATEKGNIITFSDTVDANTIFYQEYEFIGYAHVQGMYPKGNYKQQWNSYCLKFFASVFRETALLKGYNYGNKFRRDNAMKMSILLPVTSAGDPDWAYMEQYMREMEEKAKSRIEKLSILRK